MGIQAIGWAFAQSLQPTTKLVLLALANHADASGQCWPGIDRLVELTGLHRSSVFRSVEALVLARLIVREHRPGQSNWYRLAVSGGRTVQPEGSQGETLPVAQSDLGGRTVLPETSMNHQEPSEKHSVRKRTTRISPEWMPDDKLVAWVRQSFPILEESVHDEADKFRDHWISKGDARADWNASFRNWCRNAAKYAARSRPVSRLDGIARRNAQAIDAAMARHGVDEGCVRPLRPALRLVE